jgi:Transmembrane secretion effector
VGRALDELAGGAHLSARLVGEGRAGSFESDRPHVLDPEIVSGQADRSRLSHRAASLVRAALTSAPSGQTHEVADPLTAEPEEALVDATLPTGRAIELLRRRDFRRTYIAVVISELGDAFQYVALMWFALVAAGPLGILAVRLADSVPALLFGLHGGVVADRRDRRATMIAADLARGAVLVPIAVAGLTGHLQLWMLVAAAFAVVTATSYFEPAYGALLPTLVERRNVQAANGLVRASAEAVRVGGWAAAAGLLVFMPLSVFFLFNAASFFLSALLIGGVRARRTERESVATPRIREGFAALRPRRALAIGVVVLGAAVTISSGTWMVGVPQLVRKGLDLGAGSFSLVAGSYAVGAVASGALLSRIRVQHKVRVGLLLWTGYAAGYALFALARSLPLALLAGAIMGAIQASVLVLLYSAAQEEIPDALLGRVVGLISLVHRGAHATGLLLMGPLFAVLATRSVFVAAAIALPLVGLAGLVSLRAGTGRADAAPARARH